MTTNPGVQNSAYSCWVVLVVWVGAESAKRCIFHQDKFSGPRGPHAVSKAIGRGHWKPATKPAAHSTRIYSFHPMAWGHGIRSCPSSRSFFSLKQCFCWQWNQHGSLYGSVPRRPLSNELASSDKPWRLTVHLPPLHIYNIASTAG
jgi:hypothetical protein